MFTFCVSCHDLRGHRGQSPSEGALDELDVVGGVESDAAVLAPLAPALLVFAL